jgi:hypothetical protein
VPAALEVRRQIEPEVRREHAKLLAAERRVDLLAIPHVVLAFVALRVRVEARVISALRRLHLAQHPAGGLARHARIQRIAAGERGLCVDGEQLGVVVQHFLEVRDHPVLVHRVAAETPAELIVDAALGHAAQGERRHVQRLQIGLGRCRAGLPAAQQPGERLWVRELRRTAEAAVLRIEAARELRAAGFERRGGELAVGAGGRRIELGECGEQRVTLRPELAGMLAVPGGDAQQYVAERRQSEAGFLRKVRPAEERPLPFVRQEHGERPAATALREHLLRDLVDAVDVGTLLAIDFDVDEVVVEDARGGFVFEALFMEDRAPMA